MSDTTDPGAGGEARATRRLIIGLDWLLPCTGPARGPVRDWHALGLRGPSELLVTRTGPLAPWTLAAVADPGTLDRQSCDSVVDLSAGRAAGGPVGLCAGWTDAHTHAVFAGDRAAEFNERLAGRSYAEIAAAGGGILRTMRATRAASVDQLTAAATPRLEELLAWGARVVEVKTGYGLDVASEVRMLAAIGRLAAEFSGRLQIVATAMPAHAVPPELRATPDRYVDQVCAEILPAMAESGVACPFVDVFVEQGYFDVAQAERVAAVGEGLGMRLKAHVDEFADIGGVQWAVARGAVSVEHLLVTGDAGVAALAASDTVAVCLPLTSTFLREDYAPMRRLVDAGCALAVATDCNPGSAMSTNLHLALQLAVLGGRLTPQEALRAVTRGGAAALGGLDGPLGWDGSLRVGGPFVATALAVDGPDRLFYELGAPPRALAIA